MKSLFANDAMEGAIERAEALLKVLEDCGCAEQAETLKAVIVSARQMGFAIGVVGQVKRGKSTLINGLLGRTDDTFAPVNRFPATNVVSAFAYGPEERVTVLFAPEGEVTQTILASEIKEWACEDGNPGNHKGVKRIEVVAPFPQVGKNVRLVDTPGADNALSNLHDIVLLEYFPRLDAVIFLVTADEPLTASELELLKHMKRADLRKVLFAINKVDKCTPRDLAAGSAHNRQALASIGFGDTPIYEISAKNYQVTGTDVGTERLLAAVSEMIGAGRAKVIGERLTDIVNRQAAEAREELASDLRLCEMTGAQANTERAELVALQKRLNEAHPEMERRFRRAWVTALSVFEDGLPAIEKRMVTEYQTLIDQTAAVNLQALGQTVHTDVLKRLDELLEPPARNLREALEQAGKTLEVEYGKIPGLAPRAADPIWTTKDMAKASREIIAAGVPAAAGAFVVATIPGLVGSAIAATAPVLVWYNPLTWMAGAAIGGAAVTAATVLSPLAAFGAPILIGYAGCRAFSTWKSKVAQSKNALSLAVKDLIIEAIAETRRNFKRLGKQDEVILEEVSVALKAKLGASERRLGELLKNGPPPGRITNLKHSLQLIDGVVPGKNPSHE